MSRVPKVSACGLGLACLAMMAAPQAQAVEGGAETTLRPEIGRLTRAHGRSCTATLINQSFVLTASHCVNFSDENPEEYFFSIEPADGSASFMRFQVQEIVNFGPNVNWGGQIPNDNQLNAVVRTPTPNHRGNNDVALLLLVDSVPVQVAAPAGVALQYPAAQSPVSLFGYGYGRCHSVPGSGEGKKRTASWNYQDNTATKPDNYQTISPTGLICAEDSGGPAVTGAPDSNGSIWGVVSSGSSSFDTYGDPLTFRPQMEAIITGRQPPGFRKERHHADAWWDQLFHGVRVGPKPRPWAIGVEYALGDRILFSDQVFYSLQAHVAANNLAPGAATAFWKLHAPVCDSPFPPASLRLVSNVYDGPEWWGTIAFTNDGPASSSSYKVEFDVPAGVHCTAESDSVPAGSTLTPLTGSSPAQTVSNHCVFTWSNAAPLTANATKQFNYSADAQNFSMASNVVVTDTTCCMPEADVTFCQRQGATCGTVVAADNCGFKRKVSSCGDCLGAASCGGAGDANSCGTQLAPAADAYVRDGAYASSNFGTETVLLVKDQANNTGNTRKSFLKFDLGAISGPIAAAKLQLFGSRSTGTTRDAAYAVGSNAWNETTITWNNKPAIGGKLSADVTITSTAQYYEFDVSSFVIAQKAAGIDLVSLVVLYETETSNAPDSFNSREAATNRPRLVITQ
jgi:hypothetical protein